MILSYLHIIDILKINSHGYMSTGRTLNDSGPVFPIVKADVFDSTAEEDIVALENCIRD